MYILFHDLQATPYHNCRWKKRWLGTGLNMFLGLMTLPRKPIGFICDCVTVNTVDRHGTLQNNSPSDDTKFRTQEAEM
jgi:hypothetical protein